MSSEEKTSAGKSDNIGKEIKYNDDDDVTNGVLQDLEKADFGEWYDEHRFAENIRNGQSYFNGPSKLKPPGKFSASELLKCHRKIRYKQLNAPEENDDPDGIFYFGTQFEENLAERFLEDSVSVPETYLQNSLWIGTSIETEVGSIKLTGSTDPVIVDEDGVPIVLSEVKTSSSIEYMTEPREHHKAQAHVYMYGLSEKYDREIRDVVFLYADRKSLDVKTFHETFDEEFWQNRVIRWLKYNTYYRVFGFLPPAEPEQEWECKFCPYKNRCGQSSELYEDEDAAGFLPLYTDYPRENVVEYLEAHAEAKLTPSLAHEYPELAEQHDVFDWQCSECDAEYLWNEISWSGDDTPKCPSCNAAGETGFLRGPAPDEQHHIEVVDRPEEESA